MYAAGPGFLLFYFIAFGEFPIIATADRLWAEFVGEYAPGPGIFPSPNTKSLLVLLNFETSTCFFMLLMLRFE